MCKLFEVGYEVQRREPIYGKIMRGKVVKVVKKGALIDIDIELTEGVRHYVAGTIYRGSGSFWDVVEQPDDELPPIPDSVYYPDMVELLTGIRAAGGTSGLTLRKSPYTSSAISLSIDDSKWTRLDPDAALQLAHDLRRMAMDIKRKEKADVI